MFSTFSDTADRLLKKYTVEQIIALAGDSARMSVELTSFQAVVLIQLANTLSARDNNENALERERLLDRTIGKAIQRTEQKITLSVEIESELLAGRQRVSQCKAPVTIEGNCEPLAIDASGDTVDVNMVGDFLSPDDLPVAPGTPVHGGAVVQRVPDAILPDVLCPAVVKAKPVKAKSMSFNDKLAAAEAARLASRPDKQ